MKQQGFTLIELVAVIVLLGILAVSALPRFIDLQSDARAATLEGIAGALRSTDAQVYAKALVSGATASTGTITDAGQDIDVVFGHPAAFSANLDITELVKKEGDALVGWASDAALSDLVLDAAADTTVYLGYLSATSACYVSYAEAASAAAGPTITVVKTGC